MCNIRKLIIVVIRKLLAYSISFHIQNGVMNILVSQWCVVVFFVTFKSSKSISIFNFEGDFREKIEPSWYFRPFI